MRSCEHAQKECPECWRDRVCSIGFVGHRVTPGGQFARDAEKRTDSELSEYRALRKEGVQPDGTTRDKMTAAKAISDRLGVAYRGDNKTQTAKDAGLISSVTPIRK